ncbi:putative heterokaryon incompatibility protein [Elsinoe fawcettii]|nr:putative heterokaryon incompatibility protein [Elsinoe fawcettii]
MRLLNTATLQFLGEDEPEPANYAILSHTWGIGEVLFADIINANARTEKPTAFFKVEKACERAYEDGYDYIWIDTCCIQKDSSAELSEAINSMYTWYKHAGVCYAYLTGISGDLTMGSENFEARLKQAKWFHRGWTLQELLAPTEMIFFAEDWTVIGTKISLRQTLSNITGIDVDVLDDSRRMELASVAKRMSWAAGRITKRPEDRAYSLMGIFSINMPMLYGEGGTRAFLRLQEEIMKQSFDESLFAWVEPSTSGTKHGMLASSPDAFRGSNKMRPYEDRETRPPYAMTNRGLSIQLPLTMLDNNRCIAALDCPVPPDYPDHTFLAIYLERLPTGNNQFARVDLGTLAQVRERGSIQSIYVRQTFHDLPFQQVFPRHIFQLRNPPDQAYQCVRVVDFFQTTSRSHPPAIMSSQTTTRRWIPGPKTYGIARGARQLAVAVLFRYEKEMVAVLLGSAGDFQVGFSAVEAPGEEVTDERIGQGLLADLKGRYAPLEMGSGAETEGHDVKVKVDEVVAGGSKYYMVDIEITPKPREPDLLDLLGDLVLGHKESIPADQVEEISESRWKKKLLGKFGGR